MEYFGKSPLEKVVSIDPRLFESIKGNYFIGQTELFMISKKKFAWAGLFNPCNSNINLFISEFTVNNFSQEPILAQVWLNTTPPDLQDAKISDKVTPSNTALYPSPVPRTLIKYTDNVTGTPKGGINIFDRIVPATSTIADNKDGEIIIPPGGNFIIFFPGAKVATNLNAAFGWWEKKVRSE